MQQLGIEMIPAYSPEARGRSERAFRTHQERLVHELALHGITDMAAANAYLKFKQPAQEVGTAFVPCKGTQIAEILCEHFERTVGHDNCVSVDAMKLQIPQQRHRCHFVKTKVRVRMLARASCIMWNSVSRPRSLARTHCRAGCGRRHRLEIPRGWRSCHVHLTIRLRSGTDSLRSPNGPGGASEIRADHFQHVNVVGGQRQIAHLRARRFTAPRCKGKPPRKVWDAKLPVSGRIHTA